ncbi:deoxyuridine 5'-triphosphate nucleotidohydrolase [Alicyclobacillus cellulosilyticus]|uniref:dUTP diphosphatase n=1 Tax=Alicyclobacillus cellulosilyticus TaxID=1003997 RepID=A0A917K9X1_9BACL|nr:deoxyuridine 5'-triphosphate nucleotidohydrolase [Alicyclobacillus cellulosilyticus]
MVCGELTVKWKPVSPWFKPEYTPAYASAGAAGMDLHACIPGPLTMLPGERQRVPTGVAFQWDSPYVAALVFARSGWAWRQGVALPNGVGVIDSDYTGEIQVLLTNFGDQPVEIQPGDRIAQVVFVPVYLARLMEVAEFTPTARGARGFGSTGVAPLAGGGT